MNLNKIRGDSVILLKNINKCPFEI